MENDFYDNNEEFNFFRKFNIWRGNRSNAVFAQDLENITQFKQEMLRGNNIFNQYSQGIIN